jgi:hypothetical protein
MAFTTPMFTEVAPAQREYVGAFYTELHQNRSRNMESGVQIHRNHLIKSACHGINACQQFTLNNSYMDNPHLALRRILF